MPSLYDEFVNFHMRKAKNDKKRHVMVELPAISGFRAKKAELMTDNVLLFSFFRITIRVGGLHRDVLGHTSTSKKDSNDARSNGNS
jgi:hypothetical protein